MFRGVVRAGSDAGLMLMDAGDRDQSAAVACLHHVLCSLPHTDESAVQVGGDDLPPLVVGGVDQQRRTSGAGIVDKYVEPAELIDQQVDGDSAGRQVGGVELMDE